MPETEKNTSTYSASICLSIEFPWSLLGVDVDLLEEAAHAAGKASDSIAVARSSRVLLIKNLPFKADEHELLGTSHTYSYRNYHEFLINFLVMSTICLQAIEQ